MANCPFNTDFTSSQRNKRKKSMREMHTIRADYKAFCTSLCIRNLVTRKVTFPNRKINGLFVKKEIGVNHASFRDN